MALDGTVCKWKDWNSMKRFYIQLNGMTLDGMGWHWTGWYGTGQDGKGLDGIDYEATLLLINLLNKYNIKFLLFIFFYIIFISYYIIY